jgi:hypothetical protein
LPSIVEGKIKRVAYYLADVLTASRATEWRFCCIPRYCSATFKGLSSLSQSAANKLARVIHIIILVLLNIGKTNNNHPSLLLHNRGGTDNHSLNFKLIGTQSNRDATGARMRVCAGGTAQVCEIMAGGSYLSHSALRAHFGLGQQRLHRRQGHCGEWTRAG